MRDLRKPPAPRRVLLAEPESLSRDGLERLLEDEFRVVRTVSDFESLREAVARLRPEVVVASLSLVLSHGVERARALLATAPGARLVVLAHEEPRAVPDAPALGAAGWVLRSSTGTQLRAAVRCAMGRRLPFRARPRGAPLDATAGAAAVTPRAAEVVRLIARGKVMKQVAADLGISVRTVAFHKYKTMRALGLDSSAALVQYAVRNRMV